MKALYYFAIDYFLHKKQRKKFKTQKKFIFQNNPILTG